MWDFILQHYYEIAACILFGIGFMNLLLQRNLIKKIIGLNIMDTAVYLFLAARGFIFGRMAPVPADVSVPATVEQYVNPIPSGLVLTGIVVSVSVTAFSLALAMKLYKKYHTLNLDEVLVLAKQERKKKEEEEKGGNH